MKRLAAAALAALFVIAGCSASDRSSTASASGKPAGANGDTPNAIGEVTDPTAVVAKLHGRVLAPEGTIPVGGALVALLDKEPEPLAAGLHCATCVAFSRDVPFVTSSADGTFELPVTRAGHYFLVVQKGSFRRVRPLDVITGDQDVAAAMTTLPNKADAAKGDAIPKMAVVLGQFDHVERSLAKLGLGKIVADDVDRASLPFDLIDDGARLLGDPAMLAQYEIVLLPCSGGSGTTCDDTRPGDPAVQKNLRDFVEGGGRLYATDYNYEFVRQIWPDPIQWEGESQAMGSACEKTSYDAPGVVDDSGLHDWLGAIGHGAVTLKASWTTIASVHDVQATGPDGAPRTVKPHVWMSANKSDGAHPATVSFEHGCGRVLFSTYHTAGAARDPLMAQEKALLYVLLEVGVCVDTATPK